MPTQLNPNALTNLAAVKIELGITVSTWDDYLTRQINVVSDLFEQFCNRKFYFRAGIVEGVRGYGTDKLVVSTPPIVSVANVTYMGTPIVDMSILSYDYDAGFVMSRYGWYDTGLFIPNIAGDIMPGTQRPDMYVVTYDGGWVTPAQADADNTLTRTLPYDLEQAAIQAIAVQYQLRGMNRFYKEERLGAASVSYNDSFEDPFVKRILRQYRYIPMGL